MMRTDINIAIVAMVKLPPVDPREEELYCYSTTPGNITQGNSSLAEAIPVSRAGLFLKAILGGERASRN